VALNPAVVVRTCGDCQCAGICDNRLTAGRACIARAILSILERTSMSSVSLISCILALADLKTIFYGFFLDLEVFMNC